MKQMVDARGLVSFVEERGYRATAVTNAIAAAEGAPLVVIGFELRGPRGNKHFIPKDRDGQFSLDDAKLWADCVDYASAKGGPAR